VALTNKTVPACTTSWTSGPIHPAYGHTRHHGTRDKLRVDCLLPTGVAVTVFGDDCTFLRRVEVANGHDLRRIRILRLLLRRAPRIHPSIPERARPNWYSEIFIFGEKISAMIRHLFQSCVAYFYVLRRTSSVPPKDTILHYLTLSYTILHYLTLSYTILHYLTLFYTICFSLLEGS